ncbi:unnamed protein product [Adineta steineri]|uniref:ABC transporter domain-containing protein n=1 Tax=Adineta steineri TaxID=433720 RepID=A0A818L1Q6_9BILA|nr:unnamed protein product [Adineta steineri]
MASSDSLRQPLIKTEYEPVSSSQKLHLLIQRSVRYSYRQRCCKCCPTVLFELLFPTILIILLLLTRYGINQLAAQTETDDGTLPGTFTQHPCSQNITTPPTSSNDVFTRCFKFPPSYRGSSFGSSEQYEVSNLTNIVFEPDTPDVQELVKLASMRLLTMRCDQTAKVLSKNRNDEEDIHLLQNKTVNTVIVDFSATSDLKHGKNLIYNIMVRIPNTFLKNDPVDMSFVAYKHPSYIPDRSNATSNDGKMGSDLPEFTDVKMFVDSLLMGYQKDRQIQYELERKVMTCTPSRNDYLYTSISNFIGTVLLLMDAIFIIPYLILLTSSIREKNAKVKEILKVLGIEPILNNIAQALRTMVIYVILILFLCIACKIKLKPEAYFDTVNFGTLFLGYLMYALQLVAFCTMNAQMFNTNVRAIVFTFIIYFISNNIYALAMSWPSGLQYILIFFCPYVGGRSLFQQAVLYDLAKKDVALFRTVYRHVPVYFSTLTVMILSCFFYWGLSWYLEKVFPGEYGVPLEWNFLFKREYWRKTAGPNQVYSYDNHASTISRSSTPLVRTNSTNTPVVHVDHLVKKFGPDKIAVNDVSFDLYENQITSLLGPNGSGKTTIFNCLIGIFKQTSGTITMESGNGIDCDTRNNMETLRKAIGYCPQHDILFDLLTIEEQLEFYASARGYGKYKRQIANNMITLIDLEDARNSYCSALSGGMKRRLSLACAFVGDTKIILLDEPSSGLDPSHRRLLWDWLRTMKEGKTLLLTTHFMEESDALSDRIIIISNGIIKADGTSAKLKEQYGSGYKLVINKQPNYGTNEIEGQLRNYLPQITVETDIPGGDVVFRTNQQPNDQFVQALRQLQVMQTNNLVKNYGVQNSTMDDVFLKITRDTKDGSETGSAAYDIEKIDDQCRHVFDDRQFYTGWRYYLNQLYGLLIKTLLVRYRRWGITTVVLLLPIAYNLLSNILSRTQGTNDTFKMQPISLNPQTILYNADPSIENYFLAAIGAQSNGLKLEKRLENMSSIDKYIWQKRMDRPYTYTDIYLGFHIPAPQGDTYKIQTLSSNLISGYEVFSVASDLFYKYTLNDTSASIQSTLIYKKTGNLTIEPTLGSVFNLLSIVSCSLKILPTSLILDVFVFYLIFFYTTIYLVSERKDSFLLLLNISGLHPILYWLFTYIFDIITSIFWFCYLLAMYCLFDVAFNGSPNSRATSSSIIPLEFATPWDLRVQFYPLSILIVIPTLPFVYLMTKFYKSDILCGLAIMFKLIILHLVSIIVPIIMALVDNKFAQKLVYWILNLVSPTINAQAIITYILAKKSVFCKQMAFGFMFPPIGDDTIGWNWLILFLHAILLLLLLIAIDSGLIKPSFSFSFLSHPLSFNENILDNDVLTERQRILSLNHSATNQNPVNINNTEAQEADHLVVHDLVKRYAGRNAFAVNHLTFGAKRGEAFGLLGYNGAGKTTTFRILVGDETSTQGTAYIDGQNVNRRLRSLRHLGYCPQQDCSMDFLTVQDGLYLLARIRGVPTTRIHSIVQTIGSLFLLDPFLKNYIHQLSGGTKRRLHAALALIGPPLVAILDEPTTGVDPNARQQMQEIFSNAVKAKLTIILTSHSMDECERVCNRLGIMFNGQLACLGTIQHLKSKFGQGYTIEIKVRSVSGDINVPAIENVEAFLLAQTQFSISLREKSYSTGSFQVRQGTPADLFELLEQNKQNLNIETYTITQTTLEQIFLSFGKQQTGVVQ